MLNKIIDVFKAPPPAKELVPQEEVPSVFKHWRFRMFYAMFIAYAVFYMCRKNISVALPYIKEDLGYSYTELGLLGSTLYITYAFGKFVNGVLADRSNIRMFLTIGLLISAFCNIGFGYLSSFWALAFLWGLNGWIQSMGFPPIAKGLTFWFAQKERATKWSIWSTSHGVGTSIALFLSGLIITYFNWRFVFIIPGLLTLIVALFIFDRTRDTPAALGLPSVESYKDEPEICKEISEEIDKETFLQTFVKHILPNRVLWWLAIAYLFVYIVRYGTLDWLFIFYTKFKDYNDIQSASLIGLLSLLGIAGTVAAGFLSDKFFKARRMPLNLLSLIILAAAMFLLLVTPKNIYVLDVLLISLIGIFTYIPQVLIGGVCAVESGSKKVASAATGFTGMFGYFGAAVAGPLTGFLIDKFGWNETIIFWVLASLLGGVICFFMIRGEDRRLKGINLG